MTIERHASFAAFEAWREAAGVRLVLLTTGAATSYLDHTFQSDDILLFGRESAGVPEAVHRAAQARLCIPMRPGLRSLNVAVAVAIAVGEALRQTGGFPVTPARTNRLRKSKNFPRCTGRDKPGDPWWRTRSRRSF